MPDTSKLEKLNRELEKSEKKLRKAINDEKALQHQLKQLTRTCEFSVSSLPTLFFYNSNWHAVSEIKSLMGYRQAVRHRTLTPAFAGSNPASPVISGS